jgi:hypothetical protein
VKNGAIHAEERDTFKQDGLEHDPVRADPAFCKMLQPPMNRPRSALFGFLTRLITMRFLRVSNPANSAPIGNFRYRLRPERVRFSRRVEQDADIVNGA